MRQKLLLKFISLTKRYTLPGFDKQSIYDVFSFLFKEFQRDAINVRAGSVAFSFLLALFPATIVVFSLIPYIPIENYRETLLNSLHQFMPDNVYNTVFSTINDIISHHHSGVLSIGIILSVYYSSRGVIGLINSFDKSYPSFRRRTFVRKTLVSFKITFLLFILFILSIGLIIAGNWVILSLMNIIGVEGKPIFYLLASVKWLMIIMLFYFSISLIYFYAPAMHTRLRFFSAGSTLAAFLSILTSVLFSAYINNFGNFNKLYGSIGTLIVIMLWLYYNSLVLIIGFELNASIEINKQRNNDLINDASYE